MARRKAEAKAPEAVAEERPAVQETKGELEELSGDRCWYVIHTYSGYENKVKANLEHRIESMDVKDKVFRVIVPTEEEVEIKDGQRRNVAKKLFPGYVLVETIPIDMNKDEHKQVWYVVRHTPGVTGFVGVGGQPTSLAPQEVKAILRRMRSPEPRIKVGFRKGESVRIAEGPFADFIGEVDEINLAKGKVKVLVSFFGRETPVELDFLQVARL